MYPDMLLEMIALLNKGGHDHWSKWFQIAHNLYQKGDKLKSYKKVMGAYGGMGSFNDVFWNLPNEDHDRLEFLKGSVWEYAKTQWARKDNC